MRTGHPRRKGSTIVEVLLATALFASGMVALLQLLDRGSRTAMRGELETLAACRCDSALSSLLSQGMESLPQINRELSQDPDWNVAISTKPHATGLTQVTVIVRNRYSPHLGEFELTRLIHSGSDIR